MNSMVKMLATAGFVSCLMPVATASAAEEAKFGPAPDTEWRLHGNDVGDQEEGDLKLESSVIHRYARSTRTMSINWAWPGTSTCIPVVA